MADKIEMGGGGAASQSEDTNRAPRMTDIGRCPLRQKFRADIKPRPEAASLQPRRPEAESPQGQPIQLGVNSFQDARRLFGRRSPQAPRSKRNFRNDFGHWAVCWCPGEISSLSI